MIARGFLTDFHSYVCIAPVLVLAIGACTAADTAHAPGGKKLLAERSAATALWPPVVSYTMLHSTNIDTSVITIFWSYTS